ncbi:transcription factor PHYTOCHROME INTERACTING FACTOR-LIKE 15-like [Vigna umbellata]|uniref:transcription factor PHYTOCHROME INTERACTING FACTOR-LIKE 15-like n=1 Tax=Vigna umbellata TaxID=87088 RepID=UPI001F5E4E21|nr:transcription factor PHYTOCHROME INTERACTING FACTOR-LIKE 15-like [Vigna umbellata]
MIKRAEFSKAASSSKGSEHSSVINSCNGSVESQNPLSSDASNLVPDEQSPAVGHNSGLVVRGSRGLHRNQKSSSVGFEGKGKAETKYSDEGLLESSSVCSLGASNNRNVCGRKHDDIDDSVQNYEEAEDVVKEKPAREGTGVKRSRNAEVHNLCERKRRDKINKRMHILRELIPNCNKTDKASMLDDAIEYLKTLKLQLQIMKMGGGFCMPFMMLPGHGMMNAPHLQQLMGVEMGLRSGTTIPCNLPQFATIPLPAITDNRVHMFRFPNQVPTMPISHASFIPMVGNPRIPTGTATNMAENPSHQLTTLLASLSKNSYLNGQTELATKQPLNQVFPHQ